MSDGWSEARDALDNEIIGNHNAVNVRWLSRKLNLGMSVARKWLDKYYHENEDKLDATWAVSGIKDANEGQRTGFSQSGEENEEGTSDSNEEEQDSEIVYVLDAPSTMYAVVLVCKDKLESEKAKFLSVSSQYIYCIGNANTSDPTVLGDVSDRIMRMESLYTGPREIMPNWSDEQEKLVYSLSESLVGSQKNIEMKKQTPTAAPTARTKSNSESGSAAKAKSVSTSSSTPKTGLKTLKPAKGGFSSFFGPKSGGSTSKTSVSKSNKVEPEAKPEPETKKTEPEEPIEISDDEEDKVVIANDDDDDGDVDCEDEQDVEMEDVKEIERRRKLQSLFDEDDEEDNAVASGESGDKKDGMSSVESSPRSPKQRRHGSSATSPIIIESVESSQNAEVGGSEMEVDEDARATTEMTVSISSNSVSMALRQSPPVPVKELNVADKEEPFTDERGYFHFGNNGSNSTNDNINGPKRSSVTPTPPPTSNNNGIPSIPKFSNARRAQAKNKQSDIFSMFARKK